MNSPSTRLSWLTPSPCTVGSDDSWMGLEFCEAMREISPTLPPLLVVL
ncbi:hypothetical protein A2U01_0092444, partial [Trifolium medium]|nr:hypothetical protein [Trifolium medium]